MKKIIFGGIAVLAIVAVAAWNVSINSQKSDLSDIALANVEALANFEMPGMPVGSCISFGCQADFNYDCRVYYYAEGHYYYLGNCTWMRS